MTKKMINCTHLQLLTQVRRQAAGQWDQDEEEVTYIKYFLYPFKYFPQVMEAVDLGAVEPVAERTFTHELVVPELPVSSPQDDPDIVNTYSLVVKLVAHRTTLQLQFS